MVSTNLEADRQVEVLRQPERAAALLDPERRRLVSLLARRPDSAAGLARRTGESRQRLNYHLRALEDVGLVELREERRTGNCIERILQVSARRYVLHPETLGELAADPDQVGDRWSAAYLVSLAVRTIREVADLEERAESTGKRLATAGWSGEVRLSGPAALDRFVEDLSGAILDVVARHDAGAGRGRPFRVTAGLYPGPEDGVSEARA